ncbi:MAG: branched-chain amino acid transaminase [Candidatus Woesearchaeota archaeon]
MLSNNYKIWLDGKIINYEDAKISILSHSLHYGSSVFEGIRAYETLKGEANIFRCKEHLDRLFYSANVLSHTINFSKDEIIKACHLVLKENNLKSAYLRPIVFYDDSSMGLDYSKNKSQIAIIAWPWGKYLKDTVKAKIVSIRRISEKSLVPDAKIGGHYVNSSLATLEAKKMGYDEAILLDHDGFISEGPGENLFFVKDKILVTPKLGKILSGITRNSIILIAKDLGYEVFEREVDPNELSCFDGAFMCGTAAEFTPISSIGNINYKTEICSDIKEEFEKAVRGNNEKYTNWNSILE